MFDVGRPTVLRLVEERNWIPPPLETLLVPSNRSRLLFKRMANYIGWFKILVTCIEALRCN